MRTATEQQAKANHVAQFATPTAMPDDTPGWAIGLRQLYTGVAAEPVPAEMCDLLARLNQTVGQGR